LTLSQLFRSLLDSLKYYLGGLWRRVNDQPVPVWAQAIAFKVLITILPLILLATGIFGLVMRQDDPFANIAGYLRTFLPAYQSEQLIRMLYDLQQASGALTVLGAAFFILTVMTLFTTLRVVIGLAMGGGRHEFPNLLKGYLFDLRMGVQVSLLFLLSFGLTFLVNVVRAESLPLLAEVGFDPQFVTRGWSLVVRVMALLVPWVISVAMFAQLFYFNPRPRPPLRSAFVGAAVTALLFDTAKNVFTMYASYVGTFERLGAEAGETGLASLGSIFGLILMLVIWVYVSGLVLIVGAMVTELHEKRHTPGRSRMRQMWNFLTRRRNRPATPAALKHGFPGHAGVQEAEPPAGTSGSQ
jgi:membrane protein